MPITTWNGVAQVLGLSPDTVARRRAKLGCKRIAWFRDSDAVEAWWLVLNEPPPDKAPRPRRPRVNRDARPLDVRQLLDELSSGSAA